MTRISALLLSTLILLVSFSCKREKNISGKEFIPEDVFTEILIDMHMADGVSNDRKFYRRYADTDSIDLMSPILEKHGVSRHMFDTTLYAYSREPELFDRVYNNVIMQLNQQLDDLDDEQGEGAIDKAVREAEKRAEEASEGVE